MIVYKENRIVQKYIMSFFFTLCRISTMNILRVFVKYNRFDRSQLKTFSISLKEFFKGEKYLQNNKKMSFVDIFYV